MFKTESEILRRCLALGVIDVSQVIAWADMCIAAVESPDVALIEIALAGARSAADVAGLLREIPGSVDRESYVRGVFGRMFVLLSGDPKKMRLVAHALDRMVFDGEFLSDHQENAMRSFDDEFELARGGVFGDLDSIRSEILDFLLAESGARPTQC